MARRTGRGVIATDLEESPRFNPGIAERIARLTPRQRDAFWAIVELTPELGRGPTTGELGRALGISSYGRLATLVLRLRLAGVLRQDVDDVNKSRMRLPFPPRCCAACGHQLP